MQRMNRRKVFFGIVLAAVLLFALLSIPAPEPPLAESVAGKSFTWKQDAQWNALEATFQQSRSIGCNGLKELIDKGFRQGQRTLAALTKSQFGPDAAIFTDLEKTSSASAPWWPPARRGSGITSSS